MKCVQSEPAALDALQFRQMDSGVIDMETAINHDTRQRDVANAIASLQIENLQPSDALKRELDGYVDGRKSIAEVIAEVLRRHVPLRRG